MGAVVASAVAVRRLGAWALHHKAHVLVYSPDQLTELAATLAQRNAMLPPSCRTFPTPLSARNEGDGDAGDEMMRVSYLRRLARVM
jgi:hypothetical protein